MSYQRFEKPCRFYVWMGVDGLHVWTPNDGPKLFVGNDVVGRDNAAAMLRGCHDILMAEGMSVSVKNGKVTIEKKK